MGNVSCHVEPKNFYSNALESCVAIRSHALDPVTFQVCEKSFPQILGLVIYAIALTGTIGST